MESLLLSVTPLYAIFLAAMLIFLTIKVIRVRQSEKVMFMDGGIDDLTRAIRAHGNFIEYVPLSLILIALAELNGAAPVALHGLGAFLVIGRLLHLYSIDQQSIRFRVYGMTCTFATLLFSAIVLGLTLIR